VAVGAEHVYRTDAREFQLSFFDVASSPLAVSVGGPEIWLATTGVVMLESSEGSRVELRAGASAFVSAETSSLRLSGSGRVFRARVAQSG
jgi:mannose-6-phosphate isomerase class I